MSEELIKKLEARVAELEAKLNPPPEVPPRPRWYQPYDPTERMSPPVRLTGRERYRDQSLAEANAEFSKMTTTPTLRPLVPPSADPPPAVATTVPIGPQRDIAAIDAIALSFARREKEEELAKLVDVASKLTSEIARRNVIE
jgi:hypothetical protein